MEDWCAEPISSLHATWCHWAIAQGVRTDVLYDYSVSRKEYWKQLYMVSRSILVNAKNAPPRGTLKQEVENFVREHPEIERFPGMASVQYGPIPLYYVE